MSKAVPEIVVIGGGLAGLCASLEAARAGARVTLLCKRRPGRSGNSVVAAGNVSLPIPETGESAARFADDTLQAGGGIGDPVLVAALAEDAQGAVDFLAGLGVSLADEEGKLAPGLVPGFSHPCTIRPVLGEIPVATAGLALTLPLLHAAEAAGVRLLDWHMAVDLLRDDTGRVAGVAAVDRRGRLRRFSATAVILATGGAGRIFSCTNNTREITGSGLALAFDAGAELRDLEFVQYHPAMGLAPLRMILPTTLFGDGAVLRNRHHEAFLAASVPGGEAAATRDQMSRAIEAQIRAGRGIEGGVELDLSAVPEALRMSRYKDLWPLLRRKGAGTGDRPLIVGLTVHFCMGGVRIDRDGRTGVPGLFAAGEVAGGVHGANRLGGNALLEAMVFGRRSGRAAAGEGGAVTPVDVLPSPPEAGAGVDDPAAVRCIRQDLRTQLQESLGVLREASGLRTGLENLADLQGRFARFSARSDPLTWWETAQMLTEGLLMLTAAHHRRESRGAHFRVDFPQEDDAWRGSLFLRRPPAGSAPEVTYRRVDYRGN